jgi:hypothetical protein
MSSERFEVLLQPDPDLRRSVIQSGVLLALLGAFLLITTYGLPAAAKAALTPAWLLWNGWEIRRQRRGSRSVDQVRLTADGTVTVFGPDGRAMPARLAAGTLVLERWAWLRLDLPGVGRHGEPLSRCGTGEATWHRFRLIYRQGAAGFGHRGPA